VESQVLDVPRRAPAPSRLDAAPSSRDQRPRRGVAAAFVLLPLAAGGALLALVRGLPLDLREQAAIADAGSLPIVARTVAASLGPNGVAWRLAGAFAVALTAITAGLLARRLLRTPAASWIAAAFASMHLLTLLAGTSPAGTLAALACASALGAAAICGRSAPRLAAAAALGALCWQLLPARPGWPSAPSGLLAVLNRRPDSAPISIAGAAFCVAAVIVGLLIARRRRAGLPLATLAAAAFAAMGAGAFVRTMAEAAPARHETARFAALLDAIPPIAGHDGREVVLDPPLAPRDLAAARPARRLAATLAEASAAPSIRILRWTAPEDEGALAHEPPVVKEVLAGTVDSRVSLVAPAAGTTLRARVPDDEPEFRFQIASLPAHLCRFRILVFSESGGRTRVVERVLDDSILQKSKDDGRTTLAWRPAWRSMKCPERELRWEHGEVIPRGSAFRWTIAVDTPKGTLIAPLRDGVVAP
jgi:hypothetical protein